MKNVNPHISEYDYPEMLKVIEQGYVSERQIPGSDLRVLKYTLKATYEGNWNKQTMLARGLVIDPMGNIVAYGFPKFFNYEELDPAYVQTHLNTGYRITEKVDGSFGMIFKYGGEIFVTTPGSGDSEQANWATEFLKETGQDKEIDENVIYIVEIIYPQNRIVVDYQGKRGLFLIAARYRNSLRELKLHDLARLGIGRLVAGYAYEGAIENLRTEFPYPGNAEGFVVRCNTGFRFKMKYDEYVKLHSVATALTKKEVWRILKDGIQDELYARLKTVPDELYSAVDGYIRQLQTEWSVELFKHVGWADSNCAKTRKDFYIQANDCSAGILPSWAMLAHDKKIDKLKEAIWQSLEPYGKEIIMYNSNKDENQDDEIIG